MAGAYDENASDEHGEALQTAHIHVRDVTEMDTCRRRVYLKPALIFVALSGNEERHPSSWTQEPSGRDGQFPAYQSAV